MSHGSTRAVSCSQWSVISRFDDRLVQMFHDFPVLLCLVLLILALGTTVHAQTTLGQPIVQPSSGPCGAQPSFC